MASRDARPFNWGDLAQVIGGAIAILAAIFVYLLVQDPYGRLRIRSSTQVPNLPERELKVSRAVDPQFDSAIIGNSTSIPMQPDLLNRLTGRHFVSLSMSGLASPGTLAGAGLFLRYHPAAEIVLMALDDNWCTKGGDVDERYDFPFWLYGSDFDYLLGLVTHVSFDTIKVARAEIVGNPVDGYSPYYEVFHANNNDSIEAVNKRLYSSSRPESARYPPPYEFDPPDALVKFIAKHPNVMFVLLWMPRFLTLQPADGSPNAEADAACKRQVGKLASSSVRIVDWSGPRPENLDPANFYDPVHYRNGLALTIESEVAAAILH